MDEKKGENVREKEDRVKKKEEKGKEKKEMGSKMVNKMQNREEFRQKGHDRSRIIRGAGMNIVIGSKYRPLFSNTAQLCVHTPSVD